ncbi:MAG: rhodanese-like domain-containing protein [Propionibacteriaceae bacterium]|jgi:rhodanese-related sulfurtransferase|nr:rhodanese-like domain-containing protein [Propionibacteriaceae bacterium]
MRRLLVVALIAGLGLFGGCSSSSGAEYHKITPEDAKAIMDGTEPYILLDVRTWPEFVDSHIKGATLLPVDELGARAKEELPDKDELIIVYCRTGGRSKNAANELVKLGYTQVYDLGGIQSWPYETVNG